MKKTKEKTKRTFIVLTDPTSGSILKSATVTYKEGQTDWEYYQQIVNKKRILRDQYPDARTFVGSGTSMDDFLDAIPEGTTSSILSIFDEGETS